MACYQRNLLIVFIVQTTFLFVITTSYLNKNSVELLSKQSSLKATDKSIEINNKDFSPKLLSNLLIREVLKEEQEEERTTNKAKIFHVQVTAIHVDKAEFPLSKLLFKLTLKLALSSAEKRLESRRIKLSLNVRSANTCSSQFAGAVAAEEYYIRKARLFIVSGCDDAIRGVSRLASAWRVPVMTAAGFGVDLNDKSIHSTLVRVAFSLKNAVRFLIKILKSFSWHRVNLIVDESDANSFALKDSIEKHLLDSKEFQMNLNTIGLDLQSLMTSKNNNDSTTLFMNGQTSYNNNNMSSSSLNTNSTLFNKKSLPPILDWSTKTTTTITFSGEDKWPNEAIEQAIRDALKQSSLFSRVNILLIPQNYLRKFMLTVYDQNMANGLYTFINMPLLLITSSSDSTTSPIEQLPSDAHNYNTTKGQPTTSLVVGSSRQQQQSYAAQTGENIFLWRTIKSNRNAQAKQAFESLMSIYLKTPTTKAYVYFTAKLLNLANTDFATTTTTTTQAPNMLINMTTTGNSSSSYLIRSELPTTGNKIQLNINPYAASFYDCIQIYASVLNESFDMIEKQLQTSTSIGEKRNKLLSTLHSRVASLVRKRRFDNMVTGTININENGDRETDYTLDDMNPMTGKFSPVILYKGDSKEIERISRIHWSSDETGKVISMLFFFSFETLLLTT